MNYLSKLKFLTSGESHGPALSIILEGMPSNLPISINLINEQLKRRQGGYGRGGRMLIEKDQVEVTAGIRHSKTLGSPIAMRVNNKDWVSWQNEMAIEEATEPLKRVVTKPRPAHADLVGGLKYDFKDLRNVLERASARETTSRVVVGSICRQLLEAFGCKIAGHVVQVGSVKVEHDLKSAAEITEKSKDSQMYCVDSEAEAEMIKLIDDTKKKGDSIGGIFEVVVEGLPAGLGSHVHWDRKLDGRLAAAICSIQAVKGVELGDAREQATGFGSDLHDEISYNSDEKRFYHESNHAGGLEGGMTNGEPLVVRGFLKPIATLYTPLQSVDIETKQPFKATVERSDCCVVPAASVIGEAMVSIVLADAFLEKFGGDSFREIQRNYQSYLEQVKEY